MCRPEVDPTVVSRVHLVQSSGVFAVDGLQSEKQCTFRAIKSVKSICDTTSDEHDPVIDRRSASVKERERGGGLWKGPGESRVQ
jgi:hypothetical protein